MNVNKLIDKYGNKLNNGELQVDTSELYGDLLDLQDALGNQEYKYKDIIRILISMLEQHNYNPHSFYDTDIISDAKRLSKEI